MSADVKSYFLRVALFNCEVGVAYLISMWYKNKKLAKSHRLVNSDMETTELKSAISELSARVVKIRDWL